MTCIIGLVKDGEIIMGGDSAGVSGNSLELREDPKVFNLNGFVIGFTSSFRMGQLLRFGFNPPKQKEGQSDFNFLCTDFVDAVRVRLDTGGYRTKKDGVESGGTFLVGYKSKIYKVEEDFQVSIPLAGLTACGCGGSIALGAVAALLETKMESREIILKALMITEKYSTSVRAPFNIVTSKEV